MSKTITVQEKIVKRKVIFFKPAFDITTIRNCAEKAKNQMFTKYFFLKSKSEESKINTIDKYFEPYVVIDGKYNIEYSKNWNSSIKVDEEMQRLKISNKNFEPKFLKNRMEHHYKLLKLQGIGRYYHEKRKRIVFDQQWNEVRLDLLPYLPFEEETREIINETVHQQLTKDLKAEKEVEILKSKIFKRPNAILKIHNELFKVTERALVFKPMYKVIATHNKTQKKVTFQIDGVNGKIVSNQKEKLNLPTKEDIKEIGLTLYFTLKSKAKKIYNSLKKTGKWIYLK